MTGLRALLAILFVFLTGYQLRHSYELFIRGRLPAGFPLSATWTGVITEAEESTGLRKDDAILEINGLPFRGWSQLVRAQKLAAPGDRLFLKVQRQGQLLPVAMVWPERGSQESRTPYAVRLLLNFIAPWFALLFGFFVAFMRPRDPMAWLFLALSVSFSHMVDNRGHDWEDGLRQVVQFSNQLLAQAFAPSFLLLGLYFGFPHPKRWIHRAVWALTLFLTTYAVADAFAEAALRENAAATLPWMIRLQELEKVYTPVVFISIGIFFALLFDKYFRTADPDIKRRCGILLTALSISLTPALFYFFTVEFLPVESIPWIFTIITYTMMSLTPMGLAYAILVHRALDVRMVLRNGLQYALARGGVWIVQGIVAVIGIIWAVRFMEDQHHLGSGVHATILAAYAGLILGIRWISAPLFRWIDRRFFREAYSTEQVMAELAQKVRGFVEPDELFRTLGDRLSQALHVHEVAFFLGDGDRFQPAYALGATGEPFAVDSAPVQRLEREREPIQIFLDDGECWCYAPDVAAADRENLLRLRTQVLLPLTSARGIVGFASLGPKRSQEPYSRNDLRLLQTVGAQAGLALENGRLAASLAQEAAQKERVHRELEIANEVQQRLFPQRPLENGAVSVAGICRPALAVGGDYYDYFALENGVGLAVGDVAGKGIGAAIVMATVQASLRTQVLDADPDLGGLMTKLNRVVYEASPRNRFVTLFYGQYETATRVLTFVNAGHNQPFVISPAGAITRLATTGVAAGLQRQRRFGEIALKLEPGDLVVAFTDGISEAMNAAREEYGEARLEALLRTLAGRAPGEVIAAVLADVDAFAAGAVQHDDMTMVVLRVAGDQGCR